MSASREKKLRQEMAASGTPDPKKVRQEEERLKQRRANRLYALIAIIFVLVAAVVLIWNSNVIQRSATAATVDGVKYSAAEVDYYYHGRFNSLLQNQYASYLGISSGMDMNTKVSDTAKMFLPDITGDDVTWDAYLKDYAIKSLATVTKLNNLAKEKGYTFTEEMQKQMDDTIDSVKSTASSAGVSVSTYLKAIYGKNVTQGIFTRMLKDSIMASQYDSDYEESLSYTDEQIEAYYQEHQNELDVASYEYIYFNGTAPTTKDADGNTVDATDEEKAAAKEAAHTAAAEALDRLNAGESLEEIAKSYEIATYTVQGEGTYSTSAVGEWIFNADRVEGDVSIVESDPSTYLVLFHSRHINDYKTVNIRHILFQTDTTGLDSESDTYEADLEKAQAAAKQKAEEALIKWKAGDATEDSFAAMANEVSEDPGSNTNGGLYSQVTKGEMVAAFNNWIFDENRQVGDVGVVETSYGAHAMYFSGWDVPYWKLTAENALRSTEYSEWGQSLIKDLDVKQGFGMKFVG